MASVMTIHHDNTKIQCKRKDTILPDSFLDFGRKAEYLPTRQAVGACIVESHCQHGALMACQSQSLCVGQMLRWSRRDGGHTAHASPATFNMKMSKFEAIQAASFAMHSSTSDTASVNTRTVAAVRDTIRLSQLLGYQVADREMCRSCFRSSPTDLKCSKGTLKHV